MLNNPTTTKLDMQGKDLSLTSGKLAKQANGAVVVQYGNTVMLATAVMSKKPKEGIDFLPLTVEFSEKMYSAGKFPGGFFKREARPSTKATLLARLIDRPIRPCFPKGMHNELQVIITLLSYDPTVNHEPLCITAASAALAVSDIPFANAVAGATVGLIDGTLILNPTNKQLETSDLDIVVAGSKDAILMVEAGANEVSESTILEAIQLAHTSIKAQIELQESLVAKIGKPKLPAPEVNENEELKNKIQSFLGTSIEDNLQDGNKDETDAFLNQRQADVVEELLNEDGSNEGEIKSLFGTIKKEKIRHAIISNKIRPDGRKVDEIRQIEIEVDSLPSVHGSSVFTRGETQSLGVLTLGTESDEQIIDGVAESAKKRFILHYNFPAFSVGECGRPGTSRRELGHGALAERALQPVIPNYETFPYTIRLVSEILESNGSSSMATVCSGALAMMDGGVPIKAPVAGIAMGLLIEGSDYTILSDIQGLEDHYGDMDFKVAGTRKGITALQLDIKVSGLSNEILENALEQAHKGRQHILDNMNTAIEQPRDGLSENAPRIESITIDPSKIGIVIGPGGKMIRKIEEDSKATVSIGDDGEGKISISGLSAESINIAKSIIIGLTKEVETGEEYAGKVTKILNFGAFVEILPGKEGLIHISELTKQRLNNVEDVLKIGDTFPVIVKNVDQQNRINLAPKNLFDS
ncbi:polyribonucleotide nucleotidyltransferase [bacterium]|jgi:polyribonucleotide nucleotidyltransferase|nr:polyribonucleotide nucleotidyltransferase [bacterium]